jgi:hypothetical protein
MRIPHLSRRERLSLKMPRVCPTARVRSIAPSFRRRWKKTAAPARAHPPRRAATNAVRATIGSAAHSAARDDDAE